MFHMTEQHDSKAESQWLLSLSKWFQPVVKPPTLTLFPNYNIDEEGDVL